MKTSRPMSISSSGTSLLRLTSIKWDSWLWLDLTSLEPIRLLSTRVIIMLQLQHKAMGRIRISKYLHPLNSNLAK
jgi:hypothetical protein